MSKKDTIDLIFVEKNQEPELDNNMFPSGNAVNKVVRRISKETIINSLNGLIDDVSEVLEKVDVNQSKNIELEQISIVAEINAQGGISWVANANTSLTNSILLTFKVKTS